MKPILVILCAVGVLATGACSGTHEPHHSDALPVVAVPDATGLDVSALLTLSIDEMSRRLGPSQPVPVDFIDPTQAPLVQHGMALDSTALFRSQGLVIVVAYDYHSRKVSDLMLLGANENELMRRARLRLGAAHYLVLPVFRQRPATQLMGLRVLVVALNE